MVSGMPEHCVFHNHPQVDANTPRPRGPAYRLEAASSSNGFVVSDDVDALLPAGYKPPIGSSIYI